MNGLFAGVILGIGALACLSAWRSFRARRAQRSGASRGVLLASAAIQALIGILCIVLGVMVLVQGLPQ